MFSLKPILTTAIVISGVLIQQTVVAYPRTSKKSEINYLKSVLQTVYGQSFPELDRYIEEQYSNKSESTENMLAEGYKVCDFVEVANKHGITSQTLISEEIAKLSQNELRRRGTPLQPEQVIMLYENTMNYLCPNLE